MYQQYLPVSNEQMTKINNYFSLLEKAIDNKEDVRREEFPPIDPAIDGNREYKYHSSAKFKELASEYKQFPDRQDMDLLPSVSKEIPTTSSEPSDISNLECISISTKKSTDLSDNQQRPDDNQHMCGQLESKCTGKLPNE